MEHKIKKNLLLIASLAVASFLPVLASAQDVTITGMVGNIGVIIGNVAVAIVIIFWIITGILFLMALGDPAKLGTAKKALIFAIIGTAIVILAKFAGGIIGSALFSGT